MARGKYGKKRSVSKKRTLRAKLRKTEANRRAGNKAVREILNDLLEKVVSFEANSICRQLLHDTICKATEIAEQHTINLQPFEEFDPFDGPTVPSSTEDEYDFKWGSVEEFEEVEKQNIEVETEKYVPKIDGYRIVEIDYLLNRTVNLQYNHSKKCTAGQLEYLSEKRIGLISIFTYKCNTCSKTVSFSTEKPKDKSVLNTSAVWGTLATGSTYAHLSELLALMNIPGISGWMFFEIQRSLGFLWKESLWDVMENAAAEERKIALENGDVGTDGIPFITVLLDGGWSKRSYGHNNAASGVAVIIGKKTGKLLFVGVRNKFCSICARAENKAVTPPQHVCFKNWTGSSTSMEADIIVEGFNSSIELHNLKYKSFIADGDSTVFAKIRENVYYGKEVVKIECTNHAIKNYSKHLYNIKKNTKGIPLSVRKAITKTKIDELVQTAQKAIYANAHGDIQMLKADIGNSIDHSFGNHSRCKAYLCSNVGDVSKDEIPELQRTGGHHHIHAALSLLLAKAHLLIDNETNNRAELFMNILARFNMGKRLNLIQRDSFQLRSYLSGLRYNEGHTWHQKPWKKCFGSSPGQVLKKYMATQQTTAVKRKLSRKPRIVKRLKFTSSASPTKTKDYGPDIAAIYMTEEQLTEEVNRLIERLQVSTEQQKNIALGTVGQFQNEAYLSHRLHRLTASNFGRVVKRRKTTPCIALVKSILMPSAFSTPAIEYGKRNEIVAICKFTELTGMKVEPSGLFIDLDHGYLGASPDGIVGEDSIVEVKCLHKVVTLGISLREAVSNNQVACLKIDEHIQLRRTHDYYYQIQGQLAITRRKKCFFIVYTGDKNDLFIETIERDESFWKNIMLPKLQSFYKQCIAPEIILGRIKRNIKCDKHGTVR